MCAFIVHLCSVASKATAPKPLKLPPSSGTGRTTAHSTVEFTNATWQSYTKAMQLSKLLAPTTGKPVQQLALDIIVSVQPS